MNRYVVDDRYRGNPIVATKIARVFEEIQTEVCGEIESVLGKVSGVDNRELLRSILKTRLKYAIFFEAPLYAGPNKGAESQFSFPLPDPYTYSAGFFELNIYKIPALQSRGDVFFYFDYDKNNWIFLTKPDLPVSLSYQHERSLLNLKWLIPIPTVTPWHYLQFKNMRLIPA